MEIKLVWTNNNENEDGTRIYRSTSPIDVNDLPSPIATVGPGVTEWTDTTVQRYQRYYYRFEVYKGSDSVISAEKVIDALPYNGPGPNRLIAGDMWEGYFGFMRAGYEFFKASQLIDALSLPSSYKTNLTEYTGWFKFAWRNQILFIPSGPLALNATWEELYNAGIAYGTDDNGKYPLSVPVNQYREVSWGLHTLVPRLMTGDTANPADSEWDQLIGRTLAPVHQYQLKENWASYSTVNETEAYSASSNGRYNWTQDRSGSNNTQRILRGDNNVSTYTVNSLQYVNNTASITQGNGWRPVLVLKKNID